MLKAILKYLWRVSLFRNKWEQKHSVPDTCIDYAMQMDTPEKRDPESYEDPGPWEDPQPCKDQDPMKTLNSLMTQERPRSL